MLAQVIWCSMKVIPMANPIRIQLDQNFRSKSEVKIEGDHQISHRIRREVLPDC